MRIIETPGEMKAFAAAERADGRTLGLVPTMGYLHEGHLSLMRASAAQCDATVSSLFVNPAQFGQNEDLDKYPRNFERDCELAEGAGVDVMFTPTNEMMYPEGYRTYIQVEGWSGVLCGVTRPIHFRGVATVCCKLFNICLPHRAYFGLKDAQQCLIIQKMVADLNMDVEIMPMPLVREPDGLAMSSRNVYLSADERRDAARISQALFAARDMIASGRTDAETIRNAMAGHITASPLARIDYIELVNTRTLAPAAQAGPGTLVAAAVFFGATRLIDNIIIEG